MLQLAYFIVLLQFANGMPFGDGKTYSIYLGGKIYTVDGDNWNNHPAEAMVVNDENGVIEYIGEDEAAENFFTSGSTVYNLDGKTVLPGFHDVHMHPLEAMSEEGGVCTVASNTPPEELVDTIKNCNPNDDGNSWVMGHGHSITSILEHIKNGGRPPKEIIDEVIPNNPVIIMEETSHSVWVNSRALQLAGINRQTPNGPGGVIMKTPETGEPNGILLENAGIEIMDIAMKSVDNLDLKNYEGLLAGLEELGKNGITSVCDARTFWKRGHQNAWKRACDDGQLTVRAILGLWAYPHMDDNEQIEQLKEMYIGDYNGNKCSMRINEIKVYADGLLESTTAAMFEPYVKNLHLQGLTQNIGMNYFTQERLQKYIAQLQSFDGGNKGFDFHVHAIGDRGVEEVLNAIENSKGYDRETRHRMTHLEIVKPRDIERFASLGVIADFQVSGDFTLPSERDHIEETVGKSRAENFIPVKSVADTGAIVTLSSDWDVSTLNPFVGIQHAAQRDQQSVSIKSAIEMRTRNSAYLMRQQDTVGILKVGMEADFVIIDQDILKIPVNNIKSTKVLATVLQGMIVYRHRNNFPAVLE